MDYLHLVSVEAENDVQQVMRNRDRIRDDLVSERKSVTDYSELAMRAAKRMRRTKQKEKTGHTVCRHLLDMISETEDHQPAPRTVRHLHGVKYPLNSSTAEGFMDRAVSQYGFHRKAPTQKDPSSWSSANDRQFSLSF